MMSLLADWLSREGGALFTWWLLVTLAGLTAWPLLFRVLDGLPDRGYTLARAAGLMLIGVVFWFLGSVGALRNTNGGILAAWLVVLAGSWAAFWRWEDRPSLRAWWREHRALVLFGEALFALALVGWAAIRATNPEMFTTEKPMEIMFVNAIRASATFPPHDAWLSGYAISYYYFGYVLIAALADLGGLASGVAFNLTNALLFALTALGALGIVYNLVRARGARSGTALVAGVLGAVLVVLMGNLGTALVEFPYYGYTPGLVNADYFDFWDVEGRAGTEITLAPSGEQVRVAVDADGDGVPNWDDDPLPLDRWEFVRGLGWRYSRTIHDRDLNGQPYPVQPIAEEPIFSFTLADNHPHVLALPFAMLAIGLALNLALGGRALRRWEYPLYALWVGGMVFVNSWDAIYLVLLVGAEALRRLLRNANGVLHPADLWGVARFALGIGLGTLAIYLPWFASFTSQANGVLPNVIYPTRWQQFFLQFGVFLVILTVFLLREWRRAGWRFYWQAGLFVAALIGGGAALLTVFLGVRAWGDAALFGPIFSGANPAAGWREALPDILAKRVAALPSELWLLLFVFLVAGRLFTRPALLVAQDAPEAPPQRASHTSNYDAPTAFALLLVGAGAVLTFAPDFVYLHDNFAVRINTVFKLYYQGWLLFALASAYALWALLAETPTRAVWRVGQAAFGALAALLILGGMLYPILAVRGRVWVENGRAAQTERIAACERGEDWARLPDGSCPQQTPLTLDGEPTMVPPDEYAAIECLRALEQSGDAVLVEAPGGAYRPHESRFSALTGIPTLIGWRNHEGQWRGPTYPEVMDTRYENGVRRDRATDAEELYTTTDWARFWAIVDRYGIDYVVVGGAERTLASRDGAEAVRGLEKFAQVLTPVCASGDVAVYRVAPQ